MNAILETKPKTNSAHNRTRIYFDHAATTPLLDEVRAAMEPFWTHWFGNASSPYAVSRHARGAIDTSRQQVARLIGAHPDEIVFTSGGTESDNWALLGVALAQLPQGRNRVVMSAIEHDAVLETAELLRELGCEIVIAPVDKDGVCELEALRELVDEKTAVVSIMAVNNETGVIQEMETLAQVLAGTGAMLHCDAVQAAGKIKISAHEWGLDLMSLSAHKVGGPKGVGALWIKRGTPMRALLRGGGQERGRRAGTENVPGIVGFGAACAIAKRDLETNRAALFELREHLENGLAAMKGVEIHGVGSARAPHVVNFSLSNCRGESLALRLDLAGFAVGTGSACSSGAIEPSHVLRAMGVEKKLAKASLRVSLGVTNTRAEIDELLSELKEIVS